MDRLSRWSNDAVDWYLNKWMSLTLIGLVIVLVGGFVWGVAGWTVNPTTCRVDLADGRTVSALNCMVDQYRPQSVSGIIGKGGSVVPEHLGTGALVCRDLMYAPGAWVSCDCRP